MRIKALANKFRVESEHRKGLFYDVFPDQPFCSCPAFRFQNLKRGGACKHVEAVRAWRRARTPKAVSAPKGKGAKAKGPKAPTPVDLDAILREVRAAGKADAVAFAEKYGEAAIDELKARGDVIEEAGKLKAV